MGPPTSDVGSNVGITGAIGVSTAHLPCGARPITLPVTETGLPVGEPPGHWSITQYLKVGVEG